MGFCPKGSSGVCALKSDEFDYEKHGIHYAAQIPTESLEYCESICQNSSVKSKAMKYAEFAAIQALKDVCDMYMYNHFP